MKKKFRRLICGICAAGMLLTAFPAAAQTQISDKALFDLKSFGILNGDENGDYHFEDQITRAEFAKMVAYALNIEETPVIGSTFPDVSEETWYYRYIMQLCDARLLTGYEDGSFRPEQYVSYHEAIKILVSALGYETAAQSRGGYPSGYEQTALSIGLLYGIQMENDTLVRRDVARMIYNALDIDRMTLKYMGTRPVTEVISGNTLRSLQLKEKRDEQMLQGTGIITANAQTWLDRDNGNVNADQVEIDGVLYKIGTTDAFSLVGQEVDFYAIDGEDGLVLQSVRPTKENKTLLIDEDGFSKFSGSRLYYYETDSSAEKSFPISSEARIVKNFVPLENYVLDELGLSYGFVKVIDNTGDGRADVVFLEEYESLVVEKVKGTHLYFADGKTFRGRNFIELDDEDEDVRFMIRDVDGKSMALADIKAGDTVSLCASEDGYNIQCIVSTEIAAGTIRSVTTGTEPKITIDSETYELVSEDVYDEADHRGGTEVEAHIDFKGKIAYLDSVTLSRKYAYVLGVVEDDENLKTVARVLLPGHMKVTQEEIQSADENDESTVPILQAGNSSYEMMTLADNISVNGTRYKDSAKAGAVMTGKVFRYSTNADGEISRAEEPEQVGIGTHKKYNAYELVFGGFNDGVFGIDENTSLGICVPAEAVGDKQDYLATVRLDNGTRYMVSGYDMDEDTNNAALIVITETLDYDASNAINDYSPMAVMEEISSSVNEDGEGVWNVRFWSEGELKEYEVPTNAEIAGELAKMSAGTVFYYATTVNEELGQIQILEHLSDLGVTFDTEDAANGRTIYAEIADVDVNTLSDINYRRVDRMYLSVAGLDRTLSVDVNRRNTPDLYSYNKQSGEVKKIELEDLSPSWNSSYSNRVFVHIKYGSIKGIVMIED